MKPIIIESEKFCKLVSWTIQVEAITLFPFVICRDKSLKSVMNHEAIHIQQQIETLVIGFFMIYLLNYLINLARYKDAGWAYRYLLFEKEAYDHDHDCFYLENRKPYSWLVKTS